MDSGDDSGFGGDFYHQEDNYTRSAVLTAIPDALSSFRDDFLEDAKTKKPTAAVHADAFVGDAEEPQMATHIVAETRHTWFDEDTLAPALPTDSFFQLEQTTVFLGDRCGSAASIGNRLLSYFDAEATATVVKVSPVKFAMKAKLECQGFSCELKVRMYRQGAGHAVEFQRRDGEVFVFTSFF